MNEMLEKLGQNAKDAETVLRNLSTNDKNKTLEAAAAALVEHTEEILKANALDVENGRKNQMSEGLIDRLMLTPERIEGMASLPPFRMTTFPVLKQSPNASEVTFGRAS